MKPKCKLCGIAHWTYEEHTITSSSEEARKLGASVLGHEKRIVVFPDPNPPESVTTTTDEPMVYVPTTVPTETVVPTTVPTCDNCHKRPREGRYKVCSACRKKAYRERSR